MVNFSSIGDMAHSFMTTRQNATLKTSLQTLSKELSTGQVSDVGSHLKGDFSPLASIEHSLKSLTSYSYANKEASTFAASMQSALEVVQGFASETASTLITSGNAGQAATIEVAANDARQKFDSIVSTLNTSVAGRSLFAGTSTNTKPLASGDTMIAELTAHVAGETTAAGVASAVNDWFNSAGGGFETSGYLGSTNNLAPLQIGPNESAELQLRADNQTLRDTLEGFALAALIDEGVLGGNNVEQAALAQTSGQKVLAADGKITTLRADVGAVEARIENASTRNEAEKSGLELAKSDLIGVDQYDTAVQLQDAESQLEILYNITARLSRLTLADYLR
ncbi:flagellin [Cochlodiniinecator piscidefendens]|uniref:flagellin n=1 Tax=Cochlodiniinecator piscidefendens TaxID=2715756 RepID=UPI00140A3E43|nr:flagellin [Cochlodiniinecator piscidefendens]